MQARMTYGIETPQIARFRMRNSYYEQAIFAFFSRLARVHGDDLRLTGRKRRTLLLVEKEVAMVVEEEAHGFAFAWAYPFVHPSGGTNLALLQLHAGRAGALCIRVYCTYMYIKMHIHIYFLYKNLYIYMYRKLYITIVYV